MDRETFDENVAWLQQFFGHFLNPIQADYYWQKFKDVSDERFCEATRIATDRCPRFPTPFELQRCVNEADETHWRQLKAQQSNRPMSILAEKYPTQFGRDVFALINRLWLEDGHPDKLTRAQYEEEIEKLGVNVGEIPDRAAKRESVKGSQRKAQV